MLYVVALRHFGATGAAIVARPKVRGQLLRIGASDDAALRLRGAGDATAELFCDGAAWWIREPREAPRLARDGTVVPVGPWTLLVLLGDEEADAGGDADRSELPRFSCLDDEVGMPGDATPALLGASPWCALRLRAVDLPVAAVARRERRGPVRVYPIPGVDLRRGPERVATPTVLRDGDRLHAGGPQGPAVTFSDPREQLDRLLGVLGTEPATEPSRRVAPVSRRPDITAFEAALWAFALAALLAYVSLAWIRW